MSFECYTPRTSLHPTPTGGLFISADGKRRVIPDHWLTQAELLEGSCLLRLSYTFCVVEISGRRLGPIFDDASTGKLGAIQVAQRGSNPDEQLWVTSIVILAPASQSVSSFEREYSDA